MLDSPALVIQEVEGILSLFNDMHTPKLIVIIGVCFCS